MSSFAAIFLRCVLLLALVANGIVAPVHAHMMDKAGVATDSVAAAGEMPCHDAARDAGDQLAPADVSNSSEKHACCNSACVCDFVMTSALVPIAWIVVAPPVLSGPLDFSVGSILSPTTPPLLRPPIA
jgi:hypothetical protein